MPPTPTPDTFLLDATGRRILLDDGTVALAQPLAPDNITVTLAGMTSCEGVCMECTGRSLKYLGMRSRVNIAPFGDPRVDGPLVLGPHCLNDGLSPDPMSDVNYGSAEQYWFDTAKDYDDTACSDDHGFGGVNDGPLLNVTRESGGTWRVYSTGGYFATGGTFWDIFKGSAVRTEPINCCSPLVIANDYTSCTCTAEMGGEPRHYPMYYGGTATITPCCDEVGI